jgi:hypothetical protein
MAFSLFDVGCCCSPCSLCFDDDFQQPSGNSLPLFYTQYGSGVYLITLPINERGILDSIPISGISRTTQKAYLDSVSKCVLDWRQFGGFTEDKCPTTFTNYSCSDYLAESGQYIHRNTPRLFGSDCAIASRGSIAGYWPWISGAVQPWNSGEGWNQPSSLINYLSDKLATFTYTSGEYAQLCNPILQFQYDWPANAPLQGSASPTQITTCLGGDCNTLCNTAPFYQPTRTVTLAGGTGPFACNNGTYTVTSFFASTPHQNFAYLLNTCSGAYLSTGDFETETLRASPTDDAFGSKRCSSRPYTSWSFDEFTATRHIGLSLSKNEYVVSKSYKVVNGVATCCVKDWGETLTVSAACRIPWGTCNPSNNPNDPFVGLTATYYYSCRDGWVCADVSAPGGGFGTLDLIWNGCNITSVTSHIVGYNNCTWQLPFVTVN